MNIVDEAAEEVAVEAVIGEVSNIVVCHRCFD
jgi:hypothetical protein